jgi:hypothetical protein
MTVMTSVTGHDGNAVTFEPLRNGWSVKRIRNGALRKDADNAVDTFRAAMCSSSAFSAPTPRCSVTPA